MVARVRQRLQAWRRATTIDPARSEKGSGTYPATLITVRDSSFYLIPLSFKRGPLFWRRVSALMGPAVIFFGSFSARQIRRMRNIWSRHFWGDPHLRLGPIAPVRSARCGRCFTHRSDVAHAPHLDASRREVPRASAALTAAMAQREEVEPTGGSANDPPNEPEPAAYAAPDVTRGPNDKLN
jgi:hypothetical protein